MTTPEMENVTSSNNATSRDEVFIQTLVELAIVRYVFPVVIIAGNVTVVV